MSERRRDIYHINARRLGYRSRAAFKLTEICDRTGLIKPGDIVIDLGAAPGGWLQVASERVGISGCVLGVDLRSMESFPSPNVSTLVDDIESQDLPRRILSRIPRKADIVLSDASPNLSGIWDLDQSRQLSLASCSARIASEALRPGGAMVLKAFQGSSFDELLSSIKPLFKSVDLFKPEATRKHSSEMFLVCTGFKPPPRSSA